MQLKPTPLAYWLVRIENAIDAAGYSTGGDVGFSYQANSHTVRFEATLYDVDEVPNERFGSVVEIGEPTDVVGTLEPELSKLGLFLFDYSAERWSVDDRDHPAGVWLELELGHEGDLSEFYDEHRREFDVAPESTGDPTPDFGDRLLEGLLDESDDGGD